MIWVLRLLAAILAFAVPVAPALAQERITAPVGGISIEKPKGWFLLPPDQSLSNMQGFDFDDPQVQRTLSAPLITITRDSPETVAGVVPTLKVNYIPYAAVQQRGAIGTTLDIVDAMRPAIPDITLTVTPYAVTVAGRPAARARAHFTLTRDGEVLSTDVEMIIIPRGNAGVFTIGYAYPAGKFSETSAAFEAALATLRIEARAGQGH